jgi:hypothetical protein
MDNWPTAIETIVFVLIAGIVALGYFGALPWQRGRRHDDDD